MDFKQLNIKQKIGLLGIITLLVLITIYACYGILKTNYVTLYENQDLTKISQVTESLYEESVDFKLTNLGTEILVPREQLNQLKVGLAQQAQVSSKSPGFELFDNVDYSMTEQAQKITFQRAIQGELEFTLKNFQEIEEARVHITIPEQRLFTNDRHSVKASVSLWILPEENFNQEQVKGVQELIASSVDGLVVENVVVIDSNGRQMSNIDSDIEQSKATLAHHQELEQLYVNKALKLLSLYFNASQLAVSVTVYVDRAEQKLITRSLLVNDNNQGVVTRKKEMLKNNVKKDNKYANNNPDTNIEVEYQHGSETAERIIQPGTIEQISVGIAIAANIDATLTNKVNKLVYAGLGLNSSRGDKLSVEVFPAINQKPILKPFIPVPEAKKPPVLVSKVETPAKSAYSKWVMLSISVLVLLIIVGFTVLRNNRLTETQRETLQLEFEGWLNADKRDVHVKQS